MPAPGRKNAPESFSLHLPSEISAVENARAALLDYLRPFGISEQAANRIEVILEELVSNVARHSAHACTISMEARYAERTIHLVVEDDGEAFDPLAAPEHEGFTTLDDARLGGLGIPLVKRLSRSIEYRRAGNRNRISAVISAD